jgi:rsbT co-antagonist protein RsbR
VPPGPVSMAEPEPEIPADDRLARLVEVISLASVGEYAAARARFGELVPDTFGVVEESMRIFVDELATMDAEREQALAEATRARLEVEAKLAIIEAQRAEIRELSSPILDVWDGVVAVPLVGRVEVGAAIELTEKLLTAVVERRARWALIDLTGVDAIDASTAACLVSLARAVALVGARCVLTGMSPAAAASLVETGGELRDVQCLASLREGLRDVLRRIPRRR